MVRTIIELQIVEQRNNYVASEESAVLLQLHPEIASKKAMKKILEGIRLKNR